MAEIGPTRAAGYKEAKITPATTGSLSTETEGGGKEKANVAVLSANWLTPNRQDPAPIDIQSYLSYNPTQTNVIGLTSVYYMRAYHKILLRYVYWQRYNEPDTTGSSSGYTPSDLRNIVVMLVDKLKVS